MKAQGERLKWPLRVRVSAPVANHAANRDITALLQLGGWKSVDMVIRYAHVNTSHLAPSINRMWEMTGPDWSRARQAPKAKAK